jgi:hypothetical protein
LPARTGFLERAARRNTRLPSGYLVSQFHQDPFFERLCRPGWAFFKASRARPAPNSNWRVMTKGE